MPGIFCVYRVNLSHTEKIKINKLFILYLWTSSKIPVVSIHYLRGRLTRLTLCTRAYSKGEFLILIILSSDGNVISKIFEVKAIFTYFSVSSKCFIQIIEKLSQKIYQRSLNSVRRHSRRFLKFNFSQKPVSQIHCLAKEFVWKPVPRRNN